MAGEEAGLAAHSRSNGTSTSVDILNSTHFNSPWILLVIFVAAFIANGVLTAETSSSVEPTVTGPGGKPLPPSARRRKEREVRERRKREDFSPVRKLFFIWLSAGVVATFIGNAVNVIAHALTQDRWWCGEAAAIYICASAFFYSIFLISLVDTTPSPNIAHQITWVVALIGEILLLGATIALYTSPHQEINSLKQNNDRTNNSPSKFEIIEIVFDTLRVVILLFLAAFYVVFSLERSYKWRLSGRQGIGELDENAPLLVNGVSNGGGRVPAHGSIQNGNLTEPGAASGIGVARNGIMVGGSSNGTAGDYGSSENGNIVESGGNGHANGARRSLDENPAFYKPTTAPNRTWWEYLKGYSLFFPYLWPSKSHRLQVVVVVCFLLVLLQRVVNFAVPFQVGIVTDELSGRHGKTGMPWLSISLLVAFRFLQGPSGILGAARSVLWIPISQYSYKALTTASFEHVHSLSLDFHLGKRTGEVLSALSKGNSINNFLEQVTFQVLPMVFDLGVAIVYFGIKFDAYHALVVSIITFSYLYLTIRMARWRSEQRRQMTNLSREEDAVKNDSLTSYETVKYFNAEDYEFGRYRQAVSAFQRMEYKVTISLNVLNISQNMVFMAGLLTTSFIAAYQVTTGQREVGDFVAMLTYMSQLQQPLNFFGTFYRGMQSAMISGERLLELFKEQPTVVDEPGAVPMPTCEGQIRFENVKFSYDKRRPALENLSFTCRPGTTTAFVGESGGGKSTVFRLLFRFYNTQDGSIQLDGNDVKGITIDSLRSHIGVVPQDTILFNETVMYNLRYANQKATDEDIYAACRAASIHDKIMAMPDGYNTRVGERGLRLSGGEKQRVAIARTIIKNPRIIMLDEATAALDSDTEQNIQEALMTLSEGRTMLVIAHRLSTVTGADQILVLHAGRVIESGTHQELLAMKGRYANMWKKQIRAERAAEQVSQILAKANASRDALARPDSSGNEGGPSEDVSENEADKPNSTTLVVPSLASRAPATPSNDLRDGSLSRSGSLVDDSLDGDDKSDDGNSDEGNSAADQRDEGKPSEAKTPGKEEPDGTKSNRAEPTHRE